MEVCRMLIRHERYVGFRCPECDRINIKKISIFDFSGNKSVTLGCHCNTSYVSVTEGRGQYKVSAPCPACLELHAFTVKKAAFWDKKILSFHCPLTMLGAFCIGEYEEVVKMLSVFSQKMADFFAAYHLVPAGEKETNYVDEEIMLESVEYVYSLAFSGKILCRCGENDMRFHLVSDRIIISCQKCGRRATILADSEQSLYTLYSMENILLQ